MASVVTRRNLVILDVMVPDSGSREEFGVGNSGSSAKPSDPLKSPVGRKFES